MSVDVVPIVDEGLGNTAWLLDLGDGRGLVVDASRDLRAVRAAARRRRLRLAFAADTHLHADFVTGAVDLAAEGAELLASAAGARAYDHLGLLDGDEVDLGGLTLRALATPGHTEEHLSFVLLDDSRTLGVFTGGSLLVGAAARTDLVSADRTEDLARAQWRSLQRLAALPEGTAVWPTHGAGSFCSAPAGVERSSTIGRETATNALLRVGGEDAFVSALLGRLGTYPRYFRYLAEVNRRGPRRMTVPRPALPALSPAEVELALHTGALVVDARPVDAYAAGHIAGSVSIPLRDAFATWLGWIAGPQTPLVFVRAPDQDPEELVWQAHKIGLDEQVGELVGLDAWTAAGRAVATTELLDAGELRDRPVLDVRQRTEFAAGRVPGARNAELGCLAEGDLPPLDEGAAVMCGHGERAMTAASLLERAGRGDVGVVVGGPADWARGSNRALELGP